MLVEKCSIWQVIDEAKCSHICSYTDLKNVDSCLELWKDMYQQFPSVRNSDQFDFYIDFKDTRLFQLQFRLKLKP